MQSALHGVLGDAGQLVAADQIADDEDLGMPGHRQIGVDRDAAGVVRRWRRHLGDPPRERHGLHARRPQHGPGRVLLAGAAGLRA